MEMSEQIGQISTALAKAQGAMSAVLKNHENPFFKSSYADLADGWEVCRDVLATNELAVIQGLSTTEQSQIVVTTMLAHSSGEWVRDSLTLAPVKEDPQAAGSAITYGRRYSLFAMVGLAPKDDDDGEATLGRGKKSGKAKAVPSTQPDEGSSMESLKCPGCGEPDCPTLAWGKRVHGHGLDYYKKKDKGGTMHVDSLGSTLGTITDERVTEWTSASIHDLTPEEMMKAEKSVKAELKALGVKIKDDDEDGTF
jgi:hypothetical protein